MLGEVGVGIMGVEESVNQSLVGSVQVLRALTHCTICVCAWFLFFAFMLCRITLCSE